LVLSCGASLGNREFSQVVDIFEGIVIFVPNSSIATFNTLMDKAFLSVLFAALSFAAPSVQAQDDAAIVAPTFEADYAKGVNLVIGSSEIPVLSEDALIEEGALCVTNRNFSGALYGSVLHFLDLSKNSWGANTLVGVFSLNRPGPRRHTLFSTGNPDQGNRVIENEFGIMLLATTDAAAGGPSLRLHYDYRCADVQIKDVVIRDHVEYFIAASWQDGGDGTINLRLYFRELLDSEGTSEQYVAQSAENPSIKSGKSGVACPERQRISIGHRTQSGSDPLMGNVRLFKIYPTFRDTQAEFRALFQTLRPSVPERQQ
jgi:hypothetical protein